MEQALSKKRPHFKPPKFTHHIINERVRHAKADDLIFDKVKILLEKIKRRKLNPPSQLSHSLFFCILFKQRRHAI